MNSLQPLLVCNLFFICFFYLSYPSARFLQSIISQSLFSYNVYIILSYLVHYYLTTLYNGNMNVTFSSVHECAIALAPPVRTPTPYGGRLTWTLPGGTLLIVHLKDKNKIRHRKRWSQCMYMYYLLGYRLVGLSEDSLWEDMGTRSSERQSFLYQRSSIFKHMPKDIVEKVGPKYHTGLN